MFHPHFQRGFSASFETATFGKEFFGLFHLQVDVFLHHVLNNFQDLFPIVSVGEIREELLVIESASLSKQYNNKEVDFAISAHITKLRSSAFFISMISDAWKRFRLL